MENTMATFENANQQQKILDEFPPKVENCSQKTQKYSPEEILHKQFGHEYDLDVIQISEQIGRVSQLYNEKTLYSQQKDYFLRQNALDKFNKDSLEFHILSKMDQT